MGSSFYAPGATRSFSAATKAATGGSAFAHHTAVVRGTATGVHETLDVSKPNKAGQKIRESRDSDVHPESEAYAVGFDVTGSMHTIPSVMIEKLPMLMGMLLKKGVSEHPQVLFAAIGDACGHTRGHGGDNYPLQVGQFESGNEMDAAFSNIILEGNGHGQQFESYDLFMYYMARHTSLDCYEKRGQRGMLFIIGDERVRDCINRDEVKRVFGDYDGLEGDVPIEDILTELREKFEVFYIMPSGTSYFNESSYPHIHENLKGIFAENFIKLDDPDAVCETICGLVAMSKGMDVNAVSAHLKDSGATDAHIKAATTALAAYKGSSSHLSMTGKVTGGSLAALEPQATA